MTVSLKACNQLRPIAVGIALIGVIFSASEVAHAERLVITASSHRVLKSTEGQIVTLFGSAEKDAATVPRGSGYDVIAIVSGPRESAWIRNIGSGSARTWIEFVDSPRYCAILSARPLASILSEATLSRLKIGLKYLLSS